MGLFKNYDDCQVKKNQANYLFNTIQGIYNIIMFILIQYQ